MRLVQANPSSNQEAATAERMQSHAEYLLIAGPAVQGSAEIGARRERVARAICAACGENPDHVGDAQGYAHRWQDYLAVAAAAIAAY